jgi:hypothetical protein
MEHAEQTRSLVFVAGTDSYKYEGQTVSGLHTVFYKERKMLRS